MNKYKIISRYRAYHGSTLGTLGATGQMERKFQYEPFVPGFLHVPPPYCYRCFYGKTYPSSCNIECAYAFQSVIDYEGSESIAAVIVEPVMAGGGVIVPPDEYLPIVEKICKENDVLLIVDEVVNGFCRTGKWFGHHHWNINPDLVVMAKGITSAYMPLAATAATEEVFKKFYGNPDDPVHLRHINTCGGHPVACAVGLENVRIMEEENLCERAARMGEYFIGGLKEMEARYPVVGQVRGKGLFIDIELVDDKHSKRPASNATVGVVMGHVLSRGVIVGRNANTVRNMNNVIILAPPLVISKEEVDRILVFLEEAFNLFK